MNKKASGGPAEVLGVEKRQLIQSVTVDGKKSSLIAKTSFNRDKGLGQFDITVHSKHLSFEIGEKDYLMDHLLILASAAYDLIVESIREKLAAEGPEAHGQLNAFADQEEGERLTAKRTRLKPSKETVVVIGESSTGN